MTWRGGVGGGEAQEGGDIGIHIADTLGGLHSKYSYISCDVHLCLSSVSSFLLPMFRTLSGILWHQMQIVLIIRETDL